MFQQGSQAAYLSASAEGATQIGLHVMVYSTLAGDLLRAGEACRQGDIQSRCSASNRALLLLGHLEAWASTLDDQTLANSLQTFYQGIRREIVRLQGQGRSSEFDQLSAQVEGVRGAWQAKEQALTSRQSSQQQSADPRSTRSEARIGVASAAWCA